MKNLTDKELSLLSLLILLGLTILFVIPFHNSGLILIPLTFCGIGGYAFGCLLSRQ
jgi:hypothetical protein